LVETALFTAVVGEQRYVIQQPVEIATEAAAGVRLRQDGEMVAASRLADLND
jgi:hypothetical protein